MQNLKTLTAATGALLLAVAVLVAVVWAASADAAPRKDRVKPTIKVLSPAPNSTVKTPAVKVVAVVRDNRTNLLKKNIQLRVAGRKVTAFAYNARTDRLTYNARNMGFGRGNVRITARDDAGNTGARTWGFTKSPKVDAGGPPMGRYTCYHYDRYSFAGLNFWGFFSVYPGGRYGFRFSSDPPDVNSGYYSYTNATKNLQFLSGQFKQWAWEGVHLLPGRGDGIGSNQHTVVIKEISNPLPPGEEGDGQYGYCYLP